MARDSRYEFLDVLKGIAIILMIQIHCMGWWLDKPLRELPLFSISLTLGWFAAPIFLFVVGCALAISIENRRRRGQPHRAIAIHILVRGVLIFLGGYALNFVTFAGTPRSDLQSVGVLQCIGLTIIAGYVAARWLPVFVSSLIAMGIILLTPVLRDHNVLGAIPVQGLIVNVPFQSNYALFPFAAYVLLGIDVGKLFLKTSSDQRKLGALFAVLFLLGAAAAGICGKLLVDDLFTQSAGKFPEEVDVQKAVWYPLPVFIFFHCGCVLIEFAALGWLMHLKDVKSAIWRPLTMTGRAALVIFVGHHILGYRIVHSLGGMDREYGTLSLATSMGGVLLMLIASWIYAEWWVRFKSKSP